MPETKGMTAKIEDSIVGVLAVLTDNSKTVFKTAEVWKHQLSSGTESFAGLEPFCFVSYWPADAAREGDYDLRQVLMFSILIGLESKQPGIARVGDNNHLGASRIRDLVIDAIEKTHPGATFDCDDLEFVSETEIVDAPKKYATELHFQTNWLKTS